MRSLSQHQRTLKLTIVSTPIGNLQDISLRALDALKKVDYILCEDTRRAKKLLSHFNIRNKTVSFHAHNERKRIPKILTLMEQGKTFALISDAGTPLISDPGYGLIQELIQNKFEFTCVPGASAIMGALCLSGFSTTSFMFLGFLPRSSSKRKSTLSRLSSLNQTIVLFESPDRIIGMLREIGETLGDREVAVCRELTKLHEEVLRGKASEVMAELSGRTVLGEFTVVIAPGESVPVQMSDPLIHARFGQLQKEGLSRKEALKKIARESGRSKNELYILLMKNSGK